MWNIKEGTITGPYHTYRNEESQDSYKSLQKEDYVLLVTADGAGSLKKSKEGSQFVVDRVCEKAEELFDNGFQKDSTTLEMIIKEVRKELIAQEDYKQKGCTVSVALLMHGGWCAAVVGDAFIVIHNIDKTHNFITSDPISEYANVTKLLTSDNVTVKTVDGDESVLGASVSTDGLLHCSIRDDEPLPGFWSPLVEHAAQNDFTMNNFLEFLNSKEILDDDTTIIMALERI